MMKNVGVGCDVIRLLKYSCSLTVCQVTIIYLFLISHLLCLHACWWSLFIIEASDEKQGIKFAWPYSHDCLTMEIDNQYETIFAKQEC